MSAKVLLQTSMGDTVTFRNESIIINFEGNRNVVSTSNLNGGYREDLKHAYNNSCSKHPLVKKKENANIKNCTLEGYFENIASELGLPTEYTTGMNTAALMENVAIIIKKYDKLTVTAIATAGIDVNGGSAGDLARYNEFSNEQINQVCGTINIFLLIDAKLSAGVLTRAQMTATEAKSVALRELAVPSMYSEEPATGSGTDTLIAIGNLDSCIELDGAGKHCILGQLIGQSVKEAVKEALNNQCRMNPKRQASMIWQGKRYGITEENLYEQYEKNYNRISFEEFLSRLHKLSNNNESVAYVVALYHLIDQHRWNMLSQETLNKVGLSLINNLAEQYSLPNLEPSSLLMNYHQIIEQLIESILIIVNRF